MAGLLKEEINRYSRQLLLPEIGVVGQEKLKTTGVLIVGAGGLGCPVAIYLAAAGIGRLGIVDYDKVEINNLHRQILHTEDGIGISKAQSVANAIKRLNSSVACNVFETQLTSDNAMSIIDKFDIVVDASDNAPTRYLLNDACVLSRKPLVSGSALRFEGQLTVYNLNDGPCYRCLYPVPPPPHLVTNCSDGGVMGAVPGVIGNLQALEVIKIATGLPASYGGQMLLFDGLSGSFRSVKLRGKQQQCCVCGENPSITQLQDYERFCGAPACDKVNKVTLLNGDERIDCKTYNQMLCDNIAHLLIDVREAAEFNICKLPNSYNLPISKVKNSDVIDDLKRKIESFNKESKNDNFQVVVVCRRGNDSQLAVRSLKDDLKELRLNIRDIEGGLYAWEAEIDPQFPLY